VPTARAHPPYVDTGGGTVGTHPDMKRPPTHPSELTYPCCLPALGELGEVTPRGGLPGSLGEAITGAQNRGPGVNVGAVHSLTEARIRSSFVNCTQGEAKRLNVPKDLAVRPWDDLDYLGWRDPQSPARGYLVAEVGGELTGVVLRAPDKTVGHARKSLCSLCLTVHSGGVVLMVAPRAGKPGQRGNSVGTYICSDLACSLYIRGKRDTGTTGMHETLTVEQRAARLRDNLGAFLGRVRSEPHRPGS
jgi:hypothetical protein